MLPQVLATATAAPVLAHADEAFMSALVVEQSRLMRFYQAGLDAYAGERTLRAENMAKVARGKAGNPYYAWFRAEVSEDKPVGKTPLTTSPQE